MNEFAGKTALVTGASRGIGAAAAIALAEAGCARILIHYSTNLEGARRTFESVERAGSTGVLLQGELEAFEGIQEFLAKLAPFARKIDFLINNAGSLVERARLAEFTPELFDRVVNLNVKSLWFITQAVSAGMAERGEGAIVNISSISARNGGGNGSTVYAAAKGAVSAMTKGLAKELAPAGVRVNAVSPGTVDNDFHVRFSTREALDAATLATPQGRLSTNEDMARVIVFLCSAAAGNVVGQTIEVNGGALMI
jgi:3-oxoacyl-[acyl-carrier protein] reductase